MLSKGNTQYRLMSEHGLCDGYPNGAKCKSLSDAAGSFTLEKQCSVNAVLGTS